MKKVVSAVLSLFLIFTLTACQSQTETKYLQTSVTQEYIGNMTFRSETEYDSDGRQLTFIQYTDGVETSRVEYSYTDSSVIGTITQDGETGTMKQVYEKDEAGNITHIEMYVDDVLYSVSDATYDENGNILVTTQTSITIDRTTTVTYTYDEKGNNLTVTYEYGEGLGMTTENTYDENDRLLTAMTYDLDGTLSSREEHSWDESGVEKVCAYNADGSLTSTQFITYDEHGNVLTSESFDAAGELTLRITYTYEKFEVPVE